MRYEILWVIFFAVFSTIRKKGTEEKDPTKIYSTGEIIHGLSHMISNLVGV